MNKLFVFDLDGTLLTSKNKLHPNTINALDKSQKMGHMNIIATGRSFKECHKLMCNYNFFSYYICNNGTYIYDVKKKKYFFYEFIFNELGNIFLEKISDYNSIFILHTNMGTYKTIVAKDPINFNDPIWKEFQNQSFLPLDEVVEKFQYENITQLSIKSTKNTINKIYSFFNENYKNLIDCYIANIFYFDINPKNTSKLNGVKKILKIINNNLKNVIFFGDSNNDLELLKMAGYSFCMENGTLKAKQVAKKIIGNNNTNTIAQHVIKFL